MVYSRVLKVIVADLLKCLIVNRFFVALEEDRRRNTILNELAIARVRFSGNIGIGVTLLRGREKR